MNFVILYRDRITNEHLYVWFVTICDKWPASAASRMPLVEQELIYHLDPLCLFLGLIGFLLLKLQFSNVNHCVSFVPSLSLGFVLRYVGSGYTNVVFRLSFCLLGLILSLYLVRILYFVVCWLLIRLHQSNQAHSTSCQALIYCKYQIRSIFPCCDLQNMNMLIQWTFLYSTILCEMWLWKESLRHDGEQLYQYQQNK